MYLGHFNPVAKAVVVTGAADVAAAAVDGATAATRMVVNWPLNGP